MHPPARNQEFNSKGFFVQGFGTVVSLNVQFPAVLTDPYMMKLCTIHEGSSPARRRNSARTHCHENKSPVHSRRMRSAFGDILRAPHVPHREPGRFGRL